MMPVPLGAKPVESQRLGLLTEFDEVNANLSRISWAEQLMHLEVALRLVDSLNGALVRVIEVNSARRPS